MLIEREKVLSSSFRIYIQGDGVAARCCQHLFARNGMPFFGGRESRRKMPAIMLGESAQALIGDIFQNHHLLQDAKKIRQRVVAWNRNTEPVTLPHSAVVVSETALLNNVLAMPQVQELPGNADVDWTIYASKPLPTPAVEHHFGSRIATGIMAELQPHADPETCWIESLEEGWLFLVPDSDHSAWLLCVGAAPQTLLGRSRLVAEQIKECSQSMGEFAAYPRIVSPLCEPGWLACGTAAMAFDPLCGDGTANAVREAILAFAVLQAASRGENVEALCRHYEGRLTAGFERHLLLCRDFYRSGYGGPWWDRELEKIQQGLNWCAQKTISHASFRYRLNGFELEPIQ